MDFVKSAMDFAHDRTNAASSMTSSVASNVDRATTNAAFATTKAIEIARERMNQGRDTAMAHTATAMESFKENEDAFFKSASKTVAEAVRTNPMLVGGAACVAVAMTLPATRALIWRSTIGRLQSEEAIFNACVRKSEMLALDAERASGEIQKLTAAATAAGAELKQASSKLRAAARELRSIESRTYGMDKKATSILDDLRVLPSKEAVALRDNVASTVEEVEKHRAAALATLKKIFKNGIEV